MKRTTLLLVFLAPAALSGCHAIRSHTPFRHKAPPYKSAQQEKPLEVPPGMNQPPTNQALAIPQAGTGKAPAKPAVAKQIQTPPSAQLPSAKSGTAASATGTPPTNSAPTGASAPSTTSATLDLSDTPASVYHRVGLALARGEVGSVTAHNDAARTYQIAVDTTVTKKPGGGFLHRLFHHRKAHTVSDDVTVQVSGKGTRSVVTATGDADAVSQVMAMLRERLK